MSTPVFNRLDRYVLSVAVRPLASALAVILLALLLERVLRLFRLVAGGGGPFDLVVWMTLNLVPHYLGLAIPAALFFAVHAVIARMDAESELDAIGAAGVALSRACRPFFLLAFGMMALATVVVGWLQPLGRYQYRALAHAVSQQVWDGKLPAGTLIDAGKNLQISAERVDAGGRRLEQVFLLQMREDGSQVLTTARSGRVMMASDRTHMNIQLEDGEQVHLMRNGRAQVMEFRGLADMVAVRGVPEPFRARGVEERELTLTELSQALAGRPAADIPRHHLAAEFHARLVRAVSLQFLPILAVGLGIAAKRTPRGAGLVAGGTILFLYHHALLTGESLAEIGRADPVIALWGPFALFATFNLILYLMLDRRPGAFPTWWPR